MIGSPSNVEAYEHLRRQNEIRLWRLDLSELPFPPLISRVATQTLSLLLFPVGVKKTLGLHTREHKIPIVRPSARPPCW